MPLRPDEIESVEAIIKQEVSSFFALFLRVEKRLNDIEQKLLKADQAKKTEAKTPAGERK